MTISTTGPGSTATIKLSDVTQDLDVIALRGNYNDTLVIQNAAWGLGFEQVGEHHTGVRGWRPRCTWRPRGSGRPDPRPR